MARDCTAICNNIIKILELIDMSIRLDVVHRHYEYF